MLSAVAKPRCRLLLGKSNGSPELTYTSGRLRPLIERGLGHMPWAELHYNSTILLVT